VLKIALYELKKFVRDRRWFLLFLTQPIIVVIFLGLVTWQEPKDIRVSLFNVDSNKYSEEIVQNLEDEERINFSSESSEKEALEGVKNDKFRSAVIVDIAEEENLIKGKIRIVENSTVPDLSGRVKMLVVDAVEGSLAGFAGQNVKVQAEGNLQKQIETIIHDPEQLKLVTKNHTSISIEEDSIRIAEEKNTTKSLKYFDYFLSALMVLLMIINAINLSTISITSERSEGTFERFFVTPYRKSQMIFGKFIAFSFVAIILSVLVISTLKIFFEVSLGPIWLVGIIMFITAETAIALGILISAVTHSLQESIQVGVIVFYLTLILTPFLFQSETIHPYIKNISLIVPFTYSIRAMREVNLLNMEFFDVWPNLLILIGFLVLFILLAINFLRRKAE
jgi:ABC-2 type transport system permease protein